MTGGPDMAATYEHLTRLPNGVPSPLGSEAGQERSGIPGGMGEAPRQGVGRRTEGSGKGCVQEQEGRGMSKRVAELEGAELDYWIGRAVEGELDGRMVYLGRSGEFYIEAFPDGPAVSFRPSSDWSQGGPLIERHGCTIAATPEGGWSVYDPTTGDWLWDDSLLVAGCRAIVADRFGHTVEEAQ